MCHPRAAAATATDNDGNSSGAGRGPSTTALARPAHLARCVELRSSSVPEPSHLDHQADPREHRQAHPGRAPPVGVIGRGKGNRHGKRRTGDSDTGQPRDRVTARPTHGGSFRPRVSQRFGESSELSVAVRCNTRASVGVDDLVSHNEMQEPSDFAASRALGQPARFGRAPHEPGPQPIAGAVITDLTMGTSQANALRIVVHDPHGVEIGLVERPKDHPLAGQRGLEREVTHRRRLPHMPGCARLRVVPSAADRAQLSRGNTPCQSRATLPIHGTGGVQMVQTVSPHSASTLHRSRAGGRLVHRSSRRSGEGPERGLSPHSRQGRLGRRTIGTEPR